MAACAGVSVKTLRQALALPQAMLCLDAEYPDTGKTMAEQLPAPAEPLLADDCPPPFARLQSALLRAFSGCLGFPGSLFSCKAFKS